MDGCATACGKSVVCACNFEVKGGLKWVDHASHVCLNALSVAAEVK